MPKYNDIDPSSWKKYDYIHTDSLWIIEKRDNSGVHSGHYHGNFIPQIPNQLLQRYTKQGEWVLDPFMGSGTTLIEAQRLNRNSVGIELLGDIVTEARERIEKEKKECVVAASYVADSRFVGIKDILADNGVNSVQFVILHPPYWDILKFSDNSVDLSNADTLEVFLDEFGKVVDNICSVLDRNRYCAIVISDKYANSEIVPLGFYCMELMRKQGYKHKATIIKNGGGF